MKIKTLPSDDKMDQAIAALESNHDWVFTSDEIESAVYEICLAFGKSDDEDCECEEYYDVLRILRSLATMVEARFDKCGNVDHYVQVKEQANKGT